MKILRSVRYDEQNISTPDNMPNGTEAIKSLLLQLPLELRRMIYAQSILVSRSPSPRDIHERNLRVFWEDLPSPLLGVNKQTRDEVFEILQKKDFTIRVTSYGAGFDMLGLSSFIAQQRPKSYGGLPRLWIEIWPPHPDRPIDMYYINRHLLKLREQLRAVTVGIPKLIIHFKESEIAKWTQDGEPRFELERGKSDERWSDIARVLDHFACVTSVTKAHVILPPSLKGFRWYALAACRVMEGKGTFADELEHSLAHDDNDCWLEHYYKFLTAERLRAKLDRLTYNGLCKMDDDEWFAFTEVWPHFETLDDFWAEGGSFKGEWHYRIWK